MIFILHLRCKHVEINPYLLAVGKRNGNHSLGVTRNCVVQISAAYGTQPQVIFVKGATKEPCQNLVGIGITLVNIIARVSAMQFVNPYSKEEIPRRNRLGLIIKLNAGIDSAGTTYEYLALILRVQIDEHLAVHHAGLKVLGTGQAGLLGYRKEALHRTVFNLRAVQDCQSHCYTHAVIGTKRSAAGLEPTVLYVCLNRLGHEIVVQSGILLTNHILMRLQYYRLAALISGAGRLAYQHVTHIILLCCKPARCGKLKQVLSHFLLTARRTRNPAYLQEKVHHSL